MQEELSTTDEASVLAKGILCEWFCQCIRNLIISDYRYILDESKTYMLTEVMVANIDVFSLWVQLWETSKLKGTGVVFKYFTVDNGLSA